MDGNRDDGACHTGATEMTAVSITLKSKFDHPVDAPPKQMRWGDEAPITAGSFASKHEKALAITTREQVTEIVLTGLKERVGTRLIETMTAETARDEIALMHYLLTLKRQHQGDPEVEALAAFVVNSYANLGHQGIEAALKVSIDRVGETMERAIEPSEDTRPWWGRLFGKI
jgi:hypothetical protein